MIKKLSVIILMISSVGFCYDANLFTERSSEVELLPVTIGGAVIQTGTFYVPPALHIIDIIKLAAGGNLPNLRTFDCRSIEIRSGNEITNIDLLHYLSDNSINNNPFIYSGMNIQIEYAVLFAWIQGDIPLEDGGEIFVPKVENCIYVSGCVGKPGAYEFSKGMNPRQFITLADGFTPTAD